MLINNTILGDTVNASTTRNLFTLQFTPFSILTIVSTKCVGKNKKGLRNLNTFCILKWFRI